MFGIVFFESKFFKFLNDPLSFCDAVQCSAHERKECTHIYFVHVCFVVANVRSNGRCIFSIISMLWMFFFVVILLQQIKWMFRENYHTRSHNEKEISLILQLLFREFYFYHIAIVLSSAWLHFADVSLSYFIRIDLLSFIFFLLRTIVTSFFYAMLLHSSLSIFFSTF